MVLVAITQQSMGSRFLRDVSVLVAFETVGERLYGDAWQGFEHLYAQQPPPPAPADVAERARWLVGEEARFGALSKATYAARGLCADEALRDAFDAILAQIDRDRERVVRERRAIEDDRGTEERFADFQRYEHAWKLLHGALADERLTARVDAGPSVNRHAWTDAAFGKLNLRMSTLSQPPDWSERLVTIDAKEFRRWLLAIPAKADAELDVQAWCRDQINDLVRAKASPHSRDALFRDLKAQQPSLSERQYRAIWAECAPREWQAPGRKSWRPAPKTAPKKAPSK